MVQRRPLVLAKQPGPLFGGAFGRVGRCGGLRRVVGRGCGHGLMGDASFVKVHLEVAFGYGMHGDALGDQAGRLGGG